MMIRVLFLLSLSFLLPLRACAQGVVVNVTHTQALLEYGVTDETQPCEVAVSEDPLYVPLVPDVDPGLFPGANLDTRAGVVQVGATRKFVVGGRVTERAANQRPVSRALQANTRHFYRITCGNEVRTGVFTTANIPFGDTHADAIPADPQAPGEALWPHLDYQTRSLAYVDPQTGVLLKRLSGPADLIEGGLSRPPLAWAATAIRPGGGWAGSGFPYTVSGTDNALTLMASGLRDWGSYPFTQAAQLYSSDVGGHVNWIQLRVTASTSNNACNSTPNDDQCRLAACLSTDRLTCHPSSRQLEIPLTTSLQTRTLGTPSYDQQGGWVKPGRRWLNGPETANAGGRVHCDGSTVVTGGPFNLAWGAGSGIKINGADYTVASVRHEGEVNLAENCPSGDWDFTAQNFSILLWVKSPSVDTITISSVESQWEYGVPPQWGAAAYWDYSAPRMVAGLSGRPGYMVTIPSFQGMYWVDGESGTASLINQDGNINTTCIGFAALYDPTDGSRWYCTAANSGIRSFQYRGNYQDRITAPSTGFVFNAVARVPDCNSSQSNQPCLVNTDVTPGTTLRALVAAFDPEFDQAKYATLKTIGINQDGSLIYIFYRGNENTPAWIVVFDPNATSNTAGGAGCVLSRPGCVRAAFPTWLRGPGRGQPLKGDILPNLAAGWLVYSPMLWFGGAGTGFGPWQMQTLPSFAFRTEVANGDDFNEIPGGLNLCPPNPLGVTGKKCTQVFTLSEPYDPNPGEGETGAPGEYIRVEVGDWLYANTNNFDTLRELMRVVAKDGNILTLARGQVRNKESCAPGPPVECGAGSTNVQATGFAPTLFMAASSNPVLWNYAIDPRGNGTGTHENRYTGRAHSFGRFSAFVESVGGNYDPACPRDLPDGCYGIRFLSTPEPDILSLLRTARTGITPTNPRFAGRLAFGEANAVQTHPSGMGHLSTEREREFFLDARPFNGVFPPGAPTKQRATLVSGQLWKFPASGPNRLPLNRKFFATKAQIGWRPMRDLSGPLAAIGDSSEDSFTYCVVERANECRMGSEPGEVYFNTPYLRYDFCQQPGQAGSGQDQTDVCILDQAMVQDSLMQLGMNGRDINGASQRMLGKGFAHSRMNAPFWNLQALPDNKWALFRSRFLNGFRNEVMLLKLPPLDPVREDRRDTFQSVLITTASSIPAATHSAFVEFGYAEYGSPDSFFCTGRKESCLAGRSTQADRLDLQNPFWFAGSAPASGTPCSGGCSIAVPALPGRILYYRMRFRDAAGQDAGVSGLQVAAIP